ncbi:MAG: molybdopterin-dependent oxidoreductase, partial [Nannocystaceae bacterium]
MVAPQRSGLTRRQWLLLCRSGAAAVPVALLAPKVFADPGKGPEVVLLQHTARPANLETPLEFFNTQLLPVENFYVRSHFEVPIMRSDFYQLRVDIGGGKVLRLSLKQLQEDFKPVTITAVLQCAGNGRALHRPRVGGVQWRKGACGNAEWTGVKLRDVLARAGIKKGAVGHLEMVGADTPASPQTPEFVRSIPLAKALHEDTLLAYAMNGAPLTKSHGFPVRVVVPGWVGDDWLKWVTDLRVRDTPSEGFYMQKGYRVPDPKAPGGSRPMTEMNVKSILSGPRDGARLPPVAQEITGVAFSGEAHI